MLAENHDSDLRKRPPKLVCEANALVRIRRRHPDVGHDNIGLDALYGFPKLVQVTAGGDEINVLDGVENARDAFACEKAVVTENSPDHDATIIPPSLGRGCVPTGNNVVSGPLRLRLPSGRNTADFAPYGSRSRTALIESGGRNRTLRRSDVGESGIYTHFSLQVSQQRSERRKIGRSKPIYESS